MVIIPSNLRLFRGDASKCYWRGFREGLKHGLIEPNIPPVPHPDWSEKHGTDWTIGWTNGRSEAKKINDLSS